METEPSALQPAPARLVDDFMIDDAHRQVGVALVLGISHFFLRLEEDSRFTVRSTKTHVNCCVYKVNFEYYFEANT